MFKKAISAVALLAAISCSDQTDVKTDTTEPVATTTPEEAKPVMPDLPYKVKRIDWEIGNPQNVKTVLELYEAWDNHDLSQVTDHFADTIYLRIPEEKEEIPIPRSQVQKLIGSNRNDYKDASNDILAAVSLKCTDTGEEWVMVTTYNKWTEKNGKKQALVYHDDWLLQDGKVKFLISFDKTPTRELLKSDIDK